MKMQQTIRSKLASASLVSHGSRLQFGVAIALITILPLLTLFYMLQSHASGERLSEGGMWTLGIILTTTVCLGYYLLMKYPRTIMRLRHHMELIAQGELPDSIDLLNGERDITAIEEYFNLIIAGMRERIATIQEQREELIKAEGQRVMTESLCTACHHLGQPATTIMAYLELLKREPLSSSGHRKLVACIEAADTMHDILKRLQNVTDYRPAPYCEIPGANQGSPLNIIEINNHGGGTANRRVDKIVYEPCFQ